MKNLRTFKGQEPSHVQTEQKKQYFSAIALKKPTKGLVSRHEYFGN